MTATAGYEIDLRGAPWALMKRLRRYQGERKIFEVLIEGAAGTGKSRGVGHLLFWAAHYWPGIRILVVRKTRASLSESFLETWENEVLPAHNAEFMREGPTRGHREHYDFGNGSTMVMGGLDHPTRLYSTQWDIVYVQEAIELSLDEWERFFRALRHFNGDTYTPTETSSPSPIGFQLLLGDTNPDAETHWLNERCKEGLCERLTSRMQDNPKFATASGEWTEEGAAYRAGLERLSGVRRLRLLEGKWCTAEGAVWETFSEQVHLIDRPQDLKRDLGINWFVGAIDWGHNDPCCFQVWGIDGSKRAYRVAEWYATNTGQSDWVNWAAAAYQEFQPMRSIVCDPADSQGARNAINIRLASLGAKKPVAILADNTKHGQGKGDLVGLDLVREKLKPQADGKPAIYFLRDSLRMRDEWLELNKKPTCTEREIPGYVYLVDETGKPSHDRTDPECPDHGCDATRYLCSFLWRHDQTPPEGPLKPKLGSIASALSRRNPEAMKEWLEIDQHRVRAAEREKARG